ncbi:membrane protein [Effusibacillus lacus]|uniref:Membrane protein n=1 Tax=Effusibacillus lacus TaxID=1348429 RepID=A0A292YCN9_9BACL|nr:AtpZ/AtpI family protein [Effusibacillus lacus]TCS70831.1 putative F0F1-ATPase subunit (Ca2+/Mg2+ transporter) [Effusibacillus lacus]GAX89372.1 membrane protein [Effusibacillus lacus]
MQAPKKSDKKDNPWQALGLVSAIGADLAGCVLGGVYLGMWLDGQIGTAPVFLIVGLVTGLAAGIYGIMLLIKRFM